MGKNSYYVQNILCKVETARSVHILSNNRPIVSWFSRRRKVVLSTRIFYEYLPHHHRFRTHPICNGTNEIILLYRYYNVEWVVLLCMARMDGTFGSRVVGREPPAACLGRRRIVGHVTSSPSPPPRTPPLSPRRLPLITPLPRIL